MSIERVEQLSLNFKRDFWGFGPFGRVSFLAYSALWESISRGYSFFFVRKGYKYNFLFYIIYTP